MTSKITLYSEKKLISEIKHYAKLKNTSVSKLVNEFFKNLLKENYSKSKKKSTITDKLLGRLKNSGVDIDDYNDYLEEKYLWRFC